MTNTKFRKRALLSSVAMLLVALVALGSATFAWFVDDPTAKAAGITGKSQSATGLLISTDTDSTWSHNATLAKGITDDIILAPATTANGTAYFYAEAESADASPAKEAEGVNWKAATMVDHVAGTGVYQETIKLKNTTNLTGDATDDVYLTGLEFTASSSMANAAIVAIVPSGGTPTFFKTSGGTFSKWDTLSATTAVIKEAPSTWTAVAPAAEIGTTGHTTGKIKVGTLSAFTTQLEVEVYVFLNGDDASVYSAAATAVNELISGITPHFSLASNPALTVD